MYNQEISIMIYEVQEHHKLNEGTWGAHEYYDISLPNPFLQMKVL